MSSYFPITDPIGNDADNIMDALKTRYDQIKIDSDSQGLARRVGTVFIKVIGLGAAVVAAASVPVAIAVTVTVPSIIGLTALVTAIACLSLALYLDPRNLGEMIVKDLWKDVFEALRGGDGQAIIEAVQELAKQKEKRSDAFKICLGGMDAEETMPFFHKTCFVGYLQMALECLRNSEDDLAKSNAHLALSHFDASGFPPEIEKFAKLIVDAPAKVRSMIEKYTLGTDLHALDHLLYQWSAAEKTND